MAFNFVRSSNQYLAVTDNAVLDVTGALTLSAKVRQNGANTTLGNGVVSKYALSLNQRSYVLFVDLNGKVNFVISPDGLFSIGNQLTGATSIGSNWRHCAGVFTPSNRQEVFLDGASDALKTSSVAASIYSGTSPLWVGAYFDVTTSDRAFNGDIAEVGVWNVALTADEIASLAKGMTCDQIRPQSLVFYAPLVRELRDLKNGFTITNNNGATVSDHPRVYT